jgi:hypothetical protein
MVMETGMIFLSLSVLEKPGRRLRSITRRYISRI